jgi:ribonuclease PH
MRGQDRQANELRALTFDRRFSSHAHGSVLVSLGQTRVLCCCSLEQTVPPFLVGTGKGWLTAEYNMLPGSTSPRKTRDRGGKVDGRSVEIQRLIGRSLRAVLNLQNLGERTLFVDCDVLDADGGTRTAAIDGSFVALIDALNANRSLIESPRRIVSGSVAAVSVGLVDGIEFLDLDYAEDKDAEVDFNLVMTGTGQFVEVQGTGEEATFNREQLDRLLNLGKLGIDTITELQRRVLGPDWPLD